MKNKKGFTLIELIVSFTLITVISLGFFKTILSLQQQQLLNIAKNNYKTFMVVLNNSIQADFINNKIVKIDRCGVSCYDITYEKKGLVRLNYDEKTNIISYGDIKEEIPKDYKVIDNIEFISYKSDDEGLNSYVSLNMNLKNNFESKIENIKYMYQYNKEENDIELQLEWNGAIYISKLLEHESAQHNGLVQTYATVNGEQVDAGIRYAGQLEGDNAVKNQVYFNCKDEYTSDSKTIKYGDEDYVYKDNCEVWRIIGVFNTKEDESDTEGTPRIKIVRDAFSKNMSWDSSSAGTSGTENNSGYGINQWGEVKDANGKTIYEGADLMRVLKYYGGESSTCTYCNSYNQGTCPTSNDCTSIVGQISSTSLKMVDNALWYTGATAYSLTFPVLTMYEGERSTQSGKICAGGDYCSDNVTRTTTWEGKIGLIYPSDYAYASTDASCASDIVGTNSTCNTNNWLHPSSGYYLTITPSALSSNAVRVWVVYSSNCVDTGDVRFTYGVRPALYLASNVQIIGGDGSEGNAFRLSL